MTSDDELLKRLENPSRWISEFDRSQKIDTEPQSIQIKDDQAPKQAAARIRELEAELDALKSDLSGYMSAANTYVNELHGVHAGTHVIVPVDELVSIDRGLNQMMQAAYTVKLEGTKEWDIVAGGADIHGMSDKLRAMIRAAQPGAKPKQGG